MVKCKECKNISKYGIPNQKPTHCEDHRLKKMKYIYGVKFCKCGKRPSFGFKDDKRPSCCSGCKENGMIDIKSRKCSCGKQPNFGFKDDKQPSCCSSCKKEGMIDLLHKKCSCGKHPCFGFKDDKQPTCCSVCKKVGMIDIKNKRCKCEKHPIFGFKNDKRPTCCSSCKKDGMIDIKHRKCKCGKKPNFGFKDDKRPSCCNTCKTKNMVDIVSKKCNANEKGIMCPIQGNKKYDGYCTRCFSYLFKKDPRTVNIRKKSKELQVVHHLSLKYKGFLHDKPLYVDLNGGCCPSKRRVDLRKLINNTLLCVEIDERQHKGYCKLDEERRYNNLFMDFSGKYLYTL